MEKEIFSKKIKETEDGIIIEIKGKNTKEMLNVLEKGKCCCCETGCC